jgi:Na+/serine symporter
MALCQNGGVEDLAGNNIWVAVRGWSSVLKVTLAILLSISWDTDGGTSVGDTVQEGGDTCSLVLARQSLLIALAVHTDVLRVLLAQLLNGLDDDLVATLLSHGQSGVVGVAAAAVPIAWDWLRVEGDVDAKVLCHSVRNVSRHPHVVTCNNMLK